LEKRRSTWAIILSVLLAVLLTACDQSVDNNTDISVPEQERFYGDVLLLDGLFAVVALDGDLVAYLSVDGNDNVYLYRYDLKSGENSRICELENYLMNPANCTEVDGILYLNYITGDNSHVLVAVDINGLSKEEVTVEENISGLVYSTAASGKIFSLKHTDSGKSIVDCYSPQSKESFGFLSFEKGQTAYGISAYGDNVYILLRESDGIFIRQYDPDGKEVSLTDVSFAEHLLEETQISTFQIMNDSFYLCNFSGESAVFGFDGRSSEELADSTIAKTSSGSFAQYSFYKETTGQIFIFDTADSTVREARYDVPEGFDIRYIYSDLRDPGRVLISFRQPGSRNEKVSVSLIA